MLKIFLLTFQTFQTFTIFFFFSICIFFEIIIFFYKKKNEKNNFCFSFNSNLLLLHHILFQSSNRRRNILRKKVFIISFKEIKTNFIYWKKIKGGTNNGNCGIYKNGYPDFLSSNPRTHVPWFQPFFFFVIKF